MRLALLALVLCTAPSVSFAEVGPPERDPGIGSLACAMCDQAPAQAVASFELKTVTFEIVQLEALPCQAPDGLRSFEVNGKRIDWSWRRVAEVIKRERPGLRAPEVLVSRSATSRSTPNLRRDSKRSTGHTAHQVVRRWRGSTRAG